MPVRLPEPGLAHVHRVGGHGPRRQLDGRVVDRAARARAPSARRAGRTPDSKRRAASRRSAERMRSARHRASAAGSSSSYLTSAAGQRVGVGGLLGVALGQALERQTRSTVAISACSAPAMPHVSTHLPAAAIERARQPRSTSGSRSSQNGRRTAHAQARPSPAASGRGRPAPSRAGARRPASRHIGPAAPIDEVAVRVAVGRQRRRCASGR